MGLVHASGIDPFGEGNSQRRRFDHLGLDTVEIIMDRWRDTRGLVLWCRHPFDLLYIGDSYDQPNPCIYQYYSPIEPGDLKVKREMVKHEYETYHRLVNPPIIVKGI